jgi:TolB-like protein/DNA-binding winged helix-turn-helix (wHTH) protein
MNYSPRDHGVYAFGPFRLDPVRRVLLREGMPVNLAPRLFATLLCLVENAGRVVERDELFRTVWGGRLVEEANLKQTIFSLRKTLESADTASRFIVTAPTRGYLFAAPVQFEAIPFAPANEVPEAHASPEKRTRTGTIALAVAACAALAWYLFPSPTFAPPPHSVAVLPFTNLSTDPAQTYFSDGISEELTSALSRIGGLRVAARTSSFALAPKSLTAADIGRKLNVGAILEGSVRRDGAHIRVTAALINTNTGYAYWSRTYDRDAFNMLQIQAEIAEAVTLSLQIILLGGEASKFTIGGTQNPAAFDAYLRGMKFLDATGPSAPRNALTAFDRAIALDAGFALARAHRAHALTVIATAGATTDQAEITRTLSEAQAEADRAIALAPGLGGAHLARGTALMAIQDFAGAQKEITLAHDLSPGDATITMLYANMQLEFGHAAIGIAAAEQAAALDPLTASTYIDLASAYLAARRYDDALAATRRAAILGDDQDARTMGKFIVLDNGDTKSALSICAAETVWEDNFCLAIADHAAGRSADAAFELNKLRALLGDTGAYQYAEIYAQWSRPSDALHWLQAAYRLHDSGLAGLKSDSLLEPIRQTPQYREIERRLNFPS